MAGFSKAGDADLLIGYECSFFSLTCKVKLSIDSGNTEVITFPTIYILYTVRIPGMQIMRQRHGETNRPERKVYRIYSRL